MKGGFYRYDLTNETEGGVGVLVLNSILMNSKNSQDESESVQL